jgi:hypothetical protein
MLDAGWSRASRSIPQLIGLIWHGAHYARFAAAYSFAHVAIACMHAHAYYQYTPDEALPVLAVQ